MVAVEMKADAGEGGDRAGLHDPRRVRIYRSQDARSKWEGGHMWAQRNEPTLDEPEQHAEGRRAVDPRPPRPSQPQTCEAQRTFEAERALLADAVAVPRLSARAARLRQRSEGR